MEGPDLREYVENLFGGEDPLLRTMREEAEAQGIPSIQVPFGLGRMLEILVAVTGAKRILEMGTLFGYSGTLMARALGEGGKLVTIEASARHARVARQNFERAGVSERVELLEGPALDILPTLGAEPFDLVFIDADKASYPRYLEWAIKLSHSGTVIVADNLWRGADVLSPSDPDSEGAARYNRDLAGNDRLLSIIVPRLDPSDAFGITVVR